MASPPSVLYRRCTLIFPEFARFGIVGSSATALDLGGAAVLHGVVGMGPLTAKLTSAVLATVYSYLGNRLWAFRHRANHSLPREWLVFFALNALGLLIALGAIAVSELGFNLHSQLSYNLAQVTGTALGTLFRFWSYRKWVFVAPLVPTVPVPAAEARYLAIVGPAGQAR
jgi:putative flippase GtrA